MTNEPATAGIDHVGLTVSDLGATLAFFTECLGWREVGGRPDYPAVFISDGASLLTLWQAKVEAPVAFDRRKNVGLHHLALKLPSRAAFDAVFERVSSHPGVAVEFAPEPLGAGPKEHFMVFEPSGNRIEFDYDPR